MSRHSEMWLAANATATTVLASARADRSRVRRLASIPRPLVVTLVAVRPTRLDVEPVHLLHEAGRAVASLLGLEVTARELRFRYLQSEGPPGVRIEVVGPCITRSIIADVPAGYVPEESDATVRWITAAKWAKTPPECVCLAGEPHDKDCPLHWFHRTGGYGVVETCRCPPDESHDPECPMHRPGPKVAP